MIKLIRLDGTEPDWARKRRVFVVKYCETKGWDPENLSLDQIMEIRQQPEWKAATQ